MNKDYNLEFHPYKGEKIPNGFKYSKEYQSIIDFFNKDAEDCIKNLISKVFVIKFKEKTVGFVAISLKSIERKELTRKKQRGKYNRPALVIGQLIIDESCQGKGFGTETITWVISIIKLVQKFFPCRLLFVDAINDKAANFYKQKGFKAIKSDPYTLVLDLLPILQN